MLREAARTLDVVSDAPLVAKPNQRNRAERKVARRSILRSGP
jgi:hypothetical protein